MRDKILEKTKLKESVQSFYVKVGVLVTMVVYLPGEEDVVLFSGAFEGLASSANLTFEVLFDEFWAAFHRLSSTSLKLFEMI